MKQRIGFGYDMHALIEGRELILGGVKIEHPKGLLGHSDADVLSHAIADALLGSMAWGDIGEHYPPQDPQWKDVCSLGMLKEISARISAAGWHICNIDATIVAEAPRLSSYRDVMRTSLAEACGIEPNQVSVKATTTEKLGACGRQEGVAAQAVALIGRSEG